MPQENLSDWWKWGEPEKRKTLTYYPKLKVHFEERFQTTFNKINKAPEFSQKENTQHESLQQFQTRFPKIKIRRDTFSKLKKATGKSYFDLIAAYHQNKIHLPEFIICPTTQNELQEILQWASEQKIVIIPFGGGSNVVGAFAQKDYTEPFVIIDLSTLNRLVNIDKQNHTATFEAGIYGPQLEEILQAEGFTMGHFPQSFEYSTLGGWIVTHSAGQESSHYGRIDDIVIAIKVISPHGTLQTSGYESDAEGVNIKSLFLGSEGTFGIVSEAKVRIHSLPETKKWVTAVFPSFKQGTTAIQELIQADIFPAVVRYSDEQETFFLSLLSHEIPSFLSALKSSLTKSILQFKGIEKPSIMMLRFDGSTKEAALKAQIAKRIIKKHSGFLSGESLGKKWESSRFGLPYLRDDLIERGIFVDTMETVLPWDKIGNMKAELLANLQQSKAFGNKNGILLAHLSHVYTSSSSIYFTVITKQDNEHPFEQWHEIKDIVTNTIVANGGAVSHHHSIGRDHQKWYLQKTDKLTKEVLMAIKKTLDPDFILNPGKLFDE